YRSFGTSSEGEQEAVNDLAARTSQCRAPHPADAGGLGNLRDMSDCQDEPLAVARYYLFAEPVHGPPSTLRTSPRESPGLMLGLSFRRFPANAGAAFRLGCASAARATRPELLSFIRKAGLLQQQRS